jgi:invasion protein IalB
MRARLRPLIEKSVGKPFIAICLISASPQISLAQNAPNTPVIQQMLPAHSGDRVFYHQSRDWFVKCDYQAKSNTRQCELETLMAPSEKGPGLSFGLNIITGGKNTAPVAIVRTPLNLLLSSGVAMKVDHSPIGKLAFRSCNERGCIVPFSLKGSVLTSLIKGAAVQFEFRDLSDKSHTAKFSLLGIANALKVARSFD